MYSIDVYTSIDNNQNLIINSDGIPSHFEMMDVVISLTPTSMMIYSKVNFQINLEHLMFNMSCLGK